jgi:hypothetical protein
MPDEERSVYCRLCGQARPLRNSHVFPEFFYQHAYDEKHRYEIAALGGQWIGKSRQLGVWEKLLCGECEGRLNKLETYASNVIRRLTDVEIRHPETNEVYVVGHGVDYKKFKLFLLSLIWRSGISSKIPFKGIELGDHEESIRQILLMDDPGDAGRYPSVLRMFRKQKDAMRSAIMAPFKLRHNDIVAFRSYFFGLVCTTYMVHDTDDSALDGILREDGILPIKLMTPNQEDRFIEEIIRGLPGEDE